MRISVVIPTRERGEVLRHCLTTAFASPDPDLEVVVSDNHSTDGTSDLLRGVDDPRLVVVQPEARVSMRRNFETGLRAATGDYVIFSGDDDGISPNGLALLRRLLIQRTPDAVSWEMLSYAWPSTREGQHCGFISLKYKNLFGGCGVRDPRATLAQLESARLRNYREAPNIYHGCVSRKLIDRVRAANDGTYFGGAIPDVYAGIANLVHLQRPWLWLAHPVTFGGISDRSNGAAQMSANTVTTQGEAEKSRFSHEVRSDPGRAVLHVNTPSVHALTLDMLRLVNRDHAQGRLTVDHARWFHRILSRMAGMPRPTWAFGMEALTTYAEEIGEAQTFAAIAAVHHHTGQDQATEGSRPSKSKVKLLKMVLAHPSGLRTVADAMRCLDQITGADFDPGDALNKVRRPFRWAGARARARRLTQDWQAL